MLTLACGEDASQSSGGELARKTLTTWAAKSYGLDRVGIGKAECRIRFRAIPPVRDPEIKPIGEWIEGRYSWSADRSSWTWQLEGGSVLVAMTGWSPERLGLFLTSDLGFSGLLSGDVWLESERAESHIIVDASARTFRETWWFTGAGIPTRVQRHRKTPSYVDLPTAHLDTTYTYAKVREWYAFASVETTVTVNENADHWRRTEIEWTTTEGTAVPTRITWVLKKLNPEGPEQHVEFEFSQWSFDAE